MRLGLPDTPSVVDDLYAVLLSEGFEVLEDRRGGIGGLQVVLRGGVSGTREQTAEVQISADRGHWSIGLRVAGMSRFIDSRVWAAHLDRADIGEPDVGEQARFVATRVDEAVDAAAEDPSIEEKLVRRGEEYMRRRLDYDGG